MQPPSPPPPRPSQVEGLHPQCAAFVAHGAPAAHPFLFPDLTFYEWPTYDAAADSSDGLVIVLRELSAAAAAAAEAKAQAQARARARRALPPPVKRKKRVESDCDPEEE